MVRAVCATTAFSVSELVTAARPCASRMPARSSTPSARPSPSRVRPRKSGWSRLNESRLVSTTTSWCPALKSRYDSSAPTRPHPTMMKFMLAAFDCSCCGLICGLAGLDHLVDLARFVDPVRHICDDHTGVGARKQLLAQQVCRAHMEGIMPCFARDELRYDDGDDLVGLL